MTHEELDIMEELIVPMRFRRGEQILKEGDVCRNIYYIHQGLIRQYYYKETKRKKEVTEHIGVERTIFMCIESLFKEEPTRMLVEALEPSIIYALPKVKLEMKALHNVNIQILYRKILEESLILSQIHADLLRFETADERYRKLCKMEPEVVRRTPLVHVASFLQMSPETLSRVRTNSLYE
jgi:CRP-like cAMP-binding protein